MPRPDRLFVYGTLRRSSGHPMAEALSRSSRELGPARVRGWLHDLGDYPGLVLPHSGPTGALEQAPWVLGDLHELADPSLWETLDRYEGCEPQDAEPAEFQRVEAPVERPDGTVLLSWLYEAVNVPVSAPWISGGDWLRHRDPAGG